MITRSLAEAKKAGTADHSVWFTSEPVLSDEGALPPETARELLGCYGIPVEPYIPVHSADEAAAAAEQLGYPVVVKANSPDLRLRAGGRGIRLELLSAEDVRTSFTSLHERLGDEAMLVVQRMVTPGVPTLIRAGENPSFGPVIAFGLADVTANSSTTAPTGCAAHRRRGRRPGPRGPLPPLLFGLPAGTRHSPTSPTWKP